MHKKRGHHEEHEEHVNHEAWVIPYADLLTLLMALFIVLWSTGQTDLNKLKSVSSGFADQLGVSGQGAGAGGKGVLAGSDQPTVTTTVPLTPTQESMAMAALRAQQAASEKASTNQSQLQNVENALNSQASASGTSGDFHYQLQQRGLVVSIVTEGVLFDAGSADLRPGGQVILDQIAATLAGLPNQIAIEGHTDDQPIATSQYPSNWELSTARATTVLRYLVDHHGLSPNRLSAAGYADQRPVAPNNAAGRAMNRRVDLAILSLNTADATAPATSVPPAGG